MRRLRRAAFALAALFAAGGAAVVWLGAGQMLHPSWYAHRTPEQGLDPREGDEWADAHWPQRTDPLVDYGLPFEAVEFAAEDGSTLRGWWVSGAPGARAALVTVHGAGSDRREFLRHLPVLHEAGYPVLLFDCREQGISDGSGRGISFGLREHADVSSAVGFVRAREGIERVGVIGTSQGGASVILAAAADPRIDAVVAENPFTNVFELVRDTRYGDGERPPLWLLDAIVWVALWRMNGLDAPAPIDVVGDIDPRPLLILHGSADAVIPVAHSERLRSRSGERTSLWISEGAGHAALYDHEPEQWRSRVLDFLAQAIGPVVGAGPAAAVGVGR